MRTLWLAICLAFIALYGATGASAQDGLKRFETEIKPQMELKSLTYGSASALGSAGFVLNNVVAGVPGNAGTGGKETTVKIEKGTVDELDFDPLEKGGNDQEMPRLAKLKNAGLTGRDDPL